MKRVIAIIISIIIILSSGASFFYLLSDQGKSDKQTIEDNNGEEQKDTNPLEIAKIMVENDISSSSEYINNSGSYITFVSSKTIDCQNCWDLKYKFVTSSGSLKQGDFEAIAEIRAGVLNEVKYKKIK